jgi:hypothetical protein
VKGQQIIQSAVERIRRYAAGAEIDYEILAITAAQIAEYSLPTRPEKTDASRDAVELDALPAAILRRLINQAIESHMPNTRPRGPRRRSERTVDPHTHQRASHRIHRPWCIKPEKSFKAPRRTYGERSY